MTFLPDIELNQEEKNLVEKMSKELDVPMEPKTIIEHIKKFVVVGSCRVEAAPWLPKSLGMKILMVLLFIALLYGIFFSNIVCFLIGGIMIPWVSPKMRRMAP